MEAKKAVMDQFLIITQKRFNVIAYENGFLLLQVAFVTLDRSNDHFYYQLNSSLGPEEQLGLLLLALPAPAPKPDNFNSYQLPKKNGKGFLFLFFQKIVIKQGHLRHWRSGFRISTQTQRSSARHCL